MDYKGIMDLMFIAQSEFMFNPNLEALYSENYQKASADTWNRFLELSEPYKTEMSDILCNAVFENMSAVRDDWYLPWSKSRLSWLEEVTPILEKQGYPVYPNDFIPYFGCYNENERAQAKAYLSYQSDVDDMLVSLYDKYNILPAENRSAITG